jgi:hypothetical protein
MTSTTTKTCLSLSSKKPAPGDFGDVLKMIAATIPILRCATKATKASFARRSTKNSRAPSGEVSAFLCNFLDDHGVKPAQILKKAGLRHVTQADWQDPDAVHALYMATQRFMPQTLQSDSEAASDDDEQPSLVASDSYYTCSL